MLRSAACLLAVLSLSGCFASFAYSPKVANGLLYAETSSNETASSNALGTKTGQACSKSIFGLVTTGDATVPTAAKAGGITKVASVDNQYEQILGVYAKYCVVVTGE